MAPRNKLGRGNMAMLRQARGTMTDNAIFGTSADFPRVVELEIGRIQRNPEQPRQHFDEDKLASLAASIREKGLKQPILVRELTEDSYEIVAGERRWRASQLAGKTTIFAIITADDPEEVALIENLQREDLHPLEAAGALHRLARREGYTLERIGGLIGRTHAQVSRLLGLLKLAEPIRREWLSQYQDVAKSILIEISTVDDPALQFALWEQAKQGLTVKELRTAKPLLAKKPDQDVPPTPKPIRDLVSGIGRMSRSLDLIRTHGHALSDADRASLLDLRRRIDDCLGKPGTA